MVLMQACHFSGIELGITSISICQYRLTSISDNIAGNYVKIQADFLFWNDPYNCNPRPSLEYNPSSHCVILAWR